MKFPWSKQPAPSGNKSPSSVNATLNTRESLQESPATRHGSDPEKLQTSESPITEPSHGPDTPTNMTDPPSTEKEPRSDAPEKLEPLAQTTSATTAPSEADAGPGEDDETKYIRGLPLHLLTLGLTMSTFVIALDNTIIATAIPRITTVFNSLDDVGWYGSSYLLTTTSLQPSFGKVYTYFNIKWTFMLALLIFEVGSVLCGAAVNSEMLIVGRAVAGVGAAALFSGSMIIIGYSVPLRKRPIYVGLLSSMFGVASVVGPILGGAFTDRMSPQ